MFLGSAIYLYFIYCQSFISCLS